VEKRVRQLFLSALRSNTLIYFWRGG